MDCLSDHNHIAKIIVYFYKQFQWKKHIYIFTEPESDLKLAAAAIIRVEDEVTGEVDDIIVKKEVGVDQDDLNDEETEEVIVGGGESTIQLEELPQEQGAAPEVQLSEAPPNGDLTPEMILSMMDRWWMWGSNL